jgi:hypothetical protein
MADTATTIRQLSQLQPESQVQDGLKHYLNTEFNDLDSLLAGGGGGGSGGGGGPSRKKRRTLEQEIGYWETLEKNASKEVRLFLLTLGRKDPLLMVACCYFCRTTQTAREDTNGYSRITFFRSRFIFEEIRSS